MRPDGEEKLELEDVSVRIDQNTSIHLKAITKFGDPVELTAREAYKLGNSLQQMAQEIDPDLS